MKRMIWISLLLCISLQAALPPKKTPNSNPRSHLGKIPTKEEAEAAIARSHRTQSGHAQSTNETEIIYNTLPDVSTPVKKIEQNEYEPLPIAPAGYPDYQKTPPLERKFSTATNSNGKSPDKKIRLAVTNKTPHPIKVLIKNNERSKEKKLVESTISPRKGHASQTLTSSIKTSEFPLRLSVIHDGLKNTKGTIPDKNPILEKVQVQLNENKIEVYYDNDGQLVVSPKSKK